ncbi:MAG: hypothetical protein WAX04_14005, partial [Oscillospiraceae bacterium]
FISLKFTPYTATNSDLEIQSMLPLSLCFHTCSQTTTVTTPANETMSRVGTTFATFKLIA